MPPELDLSDASATTANLTPFLALEAETDFLATEEEEAPLLSTAPDEEGASLTANEAEPLTLAAAEEEKAEVKPPCEDAPVFGL